MHLKSATGTSHEFERNYPTASSAAGIHLEEEFHRAVEAYRFFYPTISMEGCFNGGRELGIEDGKGILALSAGPHHTVFTANSDTPYASAVLDLRSMGPAVIDLPAGPYIGLVDDHHQGWVVDMGIPGPDAGSGGRYLILPPDFDRVVPVGYHAARARTNKVMLALRALPQGGNVAGALAALKKVKVHALDKPSEVLHFVDVTRRVADMTCLRWEGNLDYWKKLHEILQYEPPLDEFRAMYGQLAALGIERGKPFSPDQRMRVLLELASKEALDEMLVEAFASERPERMVWNDRRWEWVTLTEDANFQVDSHIDLRARERWFVQAILASPAMFRRRPGGGSLYFLVARDQLGAFLDGGRSYELIVPQPVPAQLFWSVTAYEAKTRSQVRMPQGKAVLSSLLDNFAPSADGAVHLYFGPRAPAGKEKQWIQTAPGTGFFLYFRIYGPSAGAFDGSWRAGDLIPLEETNGESTSKISQATLTSISTRDEVASRLGALRFKDGVPTEETAQKVYDDLDRVRAIEAFLGGLSGVSLFAMRKGFMEIGLHDNELLLFSSLMDSKSLFLTANCDTPYFFTFLNLENGPIAVEVPAHVLGVVDDMWFRWVTDLGMAGPDRGEGGRYLFVPKTHDGPLPEGGFFINRCSTNHVVILGRAFLEDGDPAPAATRIRSGLRIYRYTPGTEGSSVARFLQGQGPLHKLSTPPPTRIIEGSGVEMNTIPPNDLSFYEMLHAVVELEPADALDPELAGQFAAIGVVKGKPFRPDARTKQILADAIETGNSIARTLSFRPRDEEGFAYYGESSSWINPLLGARDLNARTQMFYLATGITPAMAMRMTGIGSQYLICALDSARQPFDGSKSYKIALPPNIPAGLFWSLTVYDNQTRSMLQTEQRFPRAGSQNYPTPAAKTDVDQSTVIYFGPKRPNGVELGNWIQTQPGKGWFVALRLYSPLEPFFAKSWQPSEIIEVKC